MKQEDIDKTAFCTPFGLYEYTRMPMGLTNSAGTFQRLMQNSMSDFMFKSLLVYLDDMLIFSTDFDDHLIRLGNVLERIRSIGLKVNPNKCVFCRDSVDFLGHTISESGIATQQSKVSSIQKLSTPTSVKQVRAFLGMAGYYLKFIPRFSHVAKPLLDMVNESHLSGLPRGIKRQRTKGSSDFKWSGECESSFRALQTKLISVPILGFPDFSKPFILDIDVSYSGLGAVLSQKQDDLSKVIAYASRTLRREEKNIKSSFKLELLGLKWAVTEKFCSYLLGNKVTVYTDNKGLTFSNKAQLGAIEQKWLSQMAVFDYEIKHRKGSLNRNADFLSRYPSPITQDETECEAASEDEDIGINLAILTPPPYS
uniref:Reverse transcriptase domain-containing protein n=1 Tax=Arion vulgaris TaxID=1028688 RepID=A0A0B7BPC7_9EUPU